MYNTYGDLIKLMMVWTSVMLFRAPVNDQDLLMVFSRVSRDRIEYSHKDQYEHYYLPLEERMKVYVDELKSKGVDSN